jgi:hypothetical protein
VPSAIPAYAAALLLSLLSCLTTAIGIALALRLRENTRAIAAVNSFCLIFLTSSPLTR